MKKNNVKEAFREDFATNYYQFDGKEIYEKIKEEIRHHRFFDDYVYVKKTNHLLSYATVFVVFILVLVVYFINSPNFKRKTVVDVDSYFNEVNVEYDKTPVIVSSSYKGEELRIYKAVKNSKTEYYYYFNASEHADVSHILFVNKDKSIEVKVEVTDHFGNLSDLVAINDHDIIEVVIIYNSDQMFSQFFIAK